MPHEGVGAHADAVGVMQKVLYVSLMDTARASSVTPCPLHAHAGCASRLVRLTLSPNCCWRRTTHWAASIATCSSAPSNCVSCSAGWG